MCRVDDPHLGVSCGAEQVVDTGFAGDQVTGGVALFPTSSARGWWGGVDRDDFGVGERSGGELLEFPGGRAGGQRARDGLGEVVTGERGIVCDQPVADRVDDVIDGRQGRVDRDPLEQGVELFGAPTDAGCFVMPLGDEQVGIDQRFGFAGGQRCLLSRFRADGTEAFEFGFDLVTPFRELAHHPLRYTGDLRSVVDRRGPADTEALREFTP